MSFRFREGSTRPTHDFDRTASLIGVMTIGSLNLDGGRFVIGQDSVAPISIQDNMTISHDGLFSVGRDLDGFAHGQRQPGA